MATAAIIILLFSLAAPSLILFLAIWLLVWCVVVALSVGSRTQQSPWCSASRPTSDRPEQAMSSRKTNQPRQYSTNLFANGLKLKVNDFPNKARKQIFDFLCRKRKITRKQAPSHMSENVNFEAFDQRSHTTQLHTSKRSAKPVVQRIIVPRYTGVIRRKSTKKSFWKLQIPRKMPKPCAHWVAYIKKRWHSWSVRGRIFPAWSACVRIRFFPVRPATSAVEVNSRFLAFNFRHFGRTAKLLVSLFLLRFCYGSFYFLRLCKG